MKITNLKQVESAAFYQRADRDAFQMSFQIIKDNRFGVPSNQKILSQVLPSFYKALWAPDGRELLGVRGNKVSGYEVTHQTIHFLISERYGKNLNQMPHLTALSEGLAGASDLYFNFMYLKNGGRTKKVAALNLYRKSAATLNVKMTRRLKRILANPFRAFQENALTSQAATLAVLEAFALAKKTGKFNYTALAKKLRQLDNFVFVMHKDIVNFVLFISAQCGHTSSRKDLKSCKDLKNILLSSESYVDFLNALRK